MKQLPAMTLTCALIGISLSLILTSRQRDSFGENKFVSREETSRQSKIVSYKGVSFACDSSLASAIEGRIKPAYLESKPCDLEPEHIMFRLAGSYASRHKSSSFHPEIHIYSIAEYRKAFATSEKAIPGITTVFDENILLSRNIVSTKPDTRELERLLSNQENAGKDQIPILPMYECTQAVKAHIQYVKFQNGEGILFVTQCNVDARLINNEELVYIFQGITSDGKNYVSATFPISAPFLPEDWSYDDAKKYDLDFDGCICCPRFENAYRAYLAGITKQLEGLLPEQYQPNLTLFEELIRSLNIQGQI